MVDVAVILDPRSSEAINFTSSLDVLKAFDLRADLATWTSSSIKLVKYPFVEEGMPLSYVFVRVDQCNKHPPEAASKVSDQKGDQSQPENTEYEHHHVLSLVSIRPS